MMNANRISLKKHGLKFVLAAALGYFIYLMLLITLQYIPINFDIAFLRIKQDEISLMHYQWAFFIHVYTSIFVLLLGSLQLSASIRIKYPHLHRYLGKAYVALILLAACPSGLILAIYANGGIIAQIAFGLLSILWFYFTFTAYRKALQRQWRAHRNFMLRSFALTLSAISLRLLKWAIATTLVLPPMDTYRIVAWAGWVVNLAIVEWYIWRK